ncbi:MAG: bacillithiol biosynthesis cysteine-adding enzyme BshC [Gemmatimonadetes bacterium]|nr:bacillithiol biosynthesis cysteine-adding enzyme BshC [Gemmatimonadota bacterium]
MKVVPRPLSGNSLIDGLLAGDPAVLNFFPGDPRQINAYRAKAREVDARFLAEDRAAAVVPLSGGGASGHDRIRAFVREGGFMVTTGQQPGLFGGPLFGLYKGLTAAALARDLESTLGRPVLPVFWIASEDHDWDEVRASHVLDSQNELREVGLLPRDGASSPSVHRIVLGPEVEEVRARFLGLHPETEFLPRWRALLEGAYRSGVTLADAFQHVMEALLGPAGVFFVEAHNPVLKARALPILLKELAETRDRTVALDARGRELERGGHALQVPILEGGSNLFLEGPKGRDRLFLDGDRFRMRSSGERLTFREVETRATDDPLVLSPNVLLRPVVESAIFPTLSYVAGPSEAAYLPETEPIFRAHGITRPIVHPRAGFFLLETKVEKVLEKFRVEIEELALPDHELQGRLLRGQMPRAIQEAIHELRVAIQRAADALDGAVPALDSTLRGPVEALRSQGASLVGEVERKVLQSLKRENEVALSQIAKARGHLFPMGRPQERVLNAFYYLARYDQEFLSRVGEGAAAAVLPHLSGGG